MKHLISGCDYMMKKKILFSFCVLFVFATVVNAQTTQKHSLSVSPGLHFGGSTLVRCAAELRYDYMLTPFFSIGTYAYYELSFGMGISGRWYPVSGSFFLEFGLGYNKLYGNSLYLNNDTDQWINYIYDYNGIEIIPGIGWRFNIVKLGGFFITPSIKYPLIYRWYKTPPFAENPNMIDPRIHGALIIYFGIGYSF